jgi:hypothetical protein
VSAIIRHILRTRETTWRLVSNQAKHTNGQYDTEEGVSIDLSLGCHIELSLGSRCEAGCGLRLKIRLPALDIEYREVSRKHRRLAVNYGPFVVYLIKIVTDGM